MKQLKLEDMTKKHLTVDKDPQPTDELIKRTPVDDTPFIIVSYEGKHFGTFGQYRITEERATTEEVRAELEKITWNRLIQIISLITEMLNKKTN